MTVYAILGKVGLVFRVKCGNGCAKGDVKDLQPPLYSDYSLLHQVRDRVSDGSFHFDEQKFQPVSADARDLVMRLMCEKDRFRLSAQQALQHPWLRPTSAQVSF